MIKKESQSPLMALLPSRGGWIGQLFDLRYAYTDALAQQRARALVSICLVIGILSVLGVILSVFVLQASRGTVQAMGIVTALVCLVSYLMVQRGSLRQASIGFVLALIGIFTWASSPYGISDIGIPGS